MKLEDKFFREFFYPFLIGICLCMIVVILFLGFFTNNNLDRKTSQNIIKLEKNFSKTNINSVNVLLTISLLKLQSSLNEQILFYQNISNKLLKSKQLHELNTKYLECALNVDKEYCEKNKSKTSHMAVWILDTQTTELNLDDSKKEVKQQLTAFTHMMHNLDSTYEVNKPNIISYYFYFEETELYISYPLSVDCENGFVFELKNFTNKTGSCVDEKGQIYDIYKMKCDYFYKNIQKSLTKSFDNNYLSNQNRTIFVTNFYSDLDDTTEREFTMCIKFDDPITRGKGYACADYFNDDMVNSLENLNSNLLGYFFISNVGFNNVFYFPQGPVSPKTSTENIYNWNINYSLKEKTHFYNEIRKIFSSNYNGVFFSEYEEIFVNGENTSNQFFTIDGKKYKYSIYPTILDNLYQKHEHILSIIYIYDEELYFDEIESFNSSITLEFILEILIFIIFCSGLLYIIYLTFNTLSKYIVIPIKNVNYMLKGINIGGFNRLQYLEFLKKKHDDNLEKLEKMYIYENNKNNNENQINAETESDLKNKYENENQESDNLTLTNKENINNLNKEKINPYDDFNEKYEEESNYIEKEINFYDFDEQLLQYRPLEIENLVKLLIDLKGALILTSSDRQVEQIIDYSYSEKIFRSFKNKEGAVICQSNIGNLQSQLLKFDKAIYHLALSLQDNKLKKFLNRNLSDEFDESDSLLNKISNLFNKQKKKEKNNILAEKQLNNSNEHFSQKIIGILINTRYCRLIYAYYMFFKNMQKLQLQKSNDDIINGQFMNTLFHTINYYHKILIQFIYLSYVKGDLVKIGESILDYIEFLIKFKFKTSSDEKYFLKIKYKDNQDRPEYRKKQEFKKNIFNKIINWFNLFDDYISYVKDYSSLGDMKSVVDDYYKNLNSENAEFKWESQSTLMFNINIQKYDFLRAKFCLCCKNYNDALFFFIRAAKKKNIVIDGLIKKRSLKHIFKLLSKMKKKYNIFRLKDLYVEKQLKEYQRDKANEKNKIFNKKSKLNHTRKISHRVEKDKYIGTITFGEEIERIKNDIFEDINECNAKQEKDIIILIDFNLYNKYEEKNLYAKSCKIDAFIEQTKIILNNYLSTYDRLGVLIYSTEYKIICPLMRVNKIDINSFLKDLNYHKNMIFSDKIEDEEYDINFDEFNLGETNISEHSKEDSFEISEKGEQITNNKITGLIKTINYINNYSKMKEEVKNEKYFIVFTDMLNIHSIDDEQIEKDIKKLKGDKGVIFLLVGKNKKFKFKKGTNINTKKDIKFGELILSKYGEKSELIYFENMKKIKTILSNNNVIKDEIIYPNEIYK